MKRRFIVEVVQLPGNAVLSDKPATAQKIARTIHSHIVEGCGYYPDFNYNTVKVTPIK